MENQGEFYYQGYGVQAHPHQAANPLPPGTAPPQPALPASAEVGLPPLPPQAAGPAPPPPPPPPPYGGTYQAPSYGYGPPSADPRSSYPVPSPADSYSYHSYPTNAYDCPAPGYGYLPYAQEPYPCHPPHSYPRPPGAFMPLPPRGTDVTCFRRKMHPPPQQNLRPKGRAFKQPKQNQRFGGNPFKRSNMVPNVEPRAYNAGFPGSVMAMHAHNMPPPSWQNRGEASFAAHDSKRRRVNGDGRPPRKDDTRIGYMRSRLDWRKGRKDRKSGEDVLEKRKDKKVERIPLTEVEVQEIQKDARRRVEEFLVRLSEMKNSEVTGRQDEANSLTVLMDEPARPNGENAPQPVCRDGASIDVIDGTQPVCRDGASTDIDGPQLDSIDVADLKAGDELLPTVPNPVGVPTFNGSVSMDMNATQLVYPILGSSDIPQSLKSSLEVPIEQDEVKDDQNLVAEAGSIADKPKILSEEEEREERTFEFFVKLLEENKGLRDVYIETCDNGVFECFMCNRLLKKRYSNLVSLVTHTINVLRTKKLPEHRGYGRAICALLDWDPFNLPKVPQNIIPRFGLEGNNMIATAGIAEPSQHVDVDKESASRNEVSEPSQHVGDHKDSASTDDVDEPSQYVDNDKEHPPKGEDEGHAPDGDADLFPIELPEENSEKQDLLAKGESITGKDGESYEEDGKLTNEGESESCMVLENAGEREQELPVGLQGVKVNSEGEHIIGVEEMKGSEVEHMDGGNGVEEMKGSELEFGAH